MSDLVPVTQADREAAADWLHDAGLATWEGAGRIRRGEESHSLVELLARHRATEAELLDALDGMLAPLEKAVSRMRGMGLEVDDAGQARIDRARALITKHKGEVK